MHERDRPSSDMGSTRLNEPAAPIQVAVLDDHEAVRAGLERIVALAPDMVSVGTASTEAELRTLLEHADPSVIVLDIFHPGLDGLALSLRLKRGPRPPRIVLYSGRGGQLLSVAAAVAGIDAVVGKSATRPALLAAIRAAARHRPPPAVSLQARARAAARLDAADHPILAMRLAGTSLAEIASTLRLPFATVADRTAGIALTLAQARA
jgi:DNA-binding NarL/FixJ family response regulator